MCGELLIFDTNQQFATHRKMARTYGGRTRTANSRRRVKVVWRKVADLKLQSRNARTHTPKQVRQIGDSIKAFGFYVPVLIDRNSNVIAGHGRIVACRLLGIEDVPTICLEHLTESQVRAFMIADNRLAEISAWDEQLLAEELKELSLVDLDFDLEAIGFETPEIDLRIESLSADTAEEEDPNDTPQIENAGPTVSRLGDLWKLGSDLVSCGNALDAAVFRTLLGKQKAAMAFIDPPYNVAIEGNVSGLGKIHHREFAMAHGEMSDDEFADFLKKAFRLLVRYSTPGSIHFICSDWRHPLQMLTAGFASYTEHKNVCVWEKDSAGMGSLS